MVEAHDLLKKTELRINPTILENASLNDIAAAVAETLGMDGKDILVLRQLSGVCHGLGIYDECRDKRTK